MSSSRSFGRSLIALSISIACLSGGTPAAGEPEVAVRLHTLPKARVQISAARFRMGSDDDAIGRAVQICALSPPSSGRCTPDLFADEKPEREVFLSAYSIDRLEVSNEAYLRCVSAGACAPSGTSETDVRIGRPQHPVASVSWREAQEYCHWVLGQLPTEAQWERAARGDSLRVFPWGQAWNTRLANHGAADDTESELDGYRYAAPADAFADGRSFYGLHNMAGNVWELVADRYGAYDPKASGVEPEGPATGSERVIRGGSWRTPPRALRVTARARVAELERRPDVGFRCAYPTPRAAAKPPQR